MKTLYLLDYNNYYNRIVKKENSLSDYQNYLVKYNGEQNDSNGNTAVIAGVNFIENDFVDTQQVVNWGGDLPNYVIVVNEDNSIASRWFVVNTVRTREGQLRLDLHRDVVVDHYDKIINAPAFIEKGIPTSIDDPAIFNSEDMQFNQIKQGETLLSDETGCAWICGFIPSDSFKDASSDPNIEANYYIEGSEDISVVGIANWEFYKYVNINPNKVVAITPFSNNYKIGVRAAYNTSFRSSNAGGTEKRSILSYADSNGSYLSSELLYRRYVYNGNATVEGNENYADTGLSVTFPLNKSVIDEDFAKGLTSGISGKASTIRTDLNLQMGALSDSQIAEITRLDNQVILDTATGIYYRITLTREAAESVVSVDPISRVGITLSSAIPSSVDGSSVEGSATSKTFIINQEGKINYSLTLTQQALVAKTTIPLQANRYHLDDSPYDMFCIPYTLEGKEPLVIYENNNPIIAAPNRFAGMAIATAIMSRLADKQIDLQLLPYCPVRYCLRNGRFDITGVAANKITGTIGEDSQNVSVVLWATTSRVQIRLTHSIPQEQMLVEKKVKSETDMYRLNSPNYAGSFQFNPQMNNGVQEFVVDCNYIPYGSYIHVAPAFSGYYGRDFNDARGLICGGDFSLPRTSNAWESYKLNNSTYQQVFDRQIQNLEVNNAVQREREKWSAAAGAIGAFGQSVSTGAMFGPYGLAAGVGAGVLSAGLSGAAGARDIQLNDKLRNETLDYTRDMFGYNLQNIQAIPTTIAKTTAITVNNKIFPFIEYYTCTDIEKQALRDKLKYNGFTIMRIGTLQQFIGSNEFDYCYVKGKLIRLEELQTEYSIAIAIAEEINKGVFI